jgi:hypothetical protein
LGESTPTFGETRPTSSVLFLLFVPPIVHKAGNGKGTGGKGLLCWGTVWRQKKACDPQRKILNKHAAKNGNLSNTEEADVAQTEWEWPMTDSQKSHSERAALLRPILYEMTTPVEIQAASTHSGKALSLNISSGGMLVLMDQAPVIEQVMKVYVPTPISMAETPTLAEVRWTRKLPFGKPNGSGAYFVGLKFMF